MVTFFFGIFSGKIGIIIERQKNGVVNMKKIIIADNGKRLVRLTTSMEYICVVRK